MALEGVEIPMRIQVMGVSMYPLIRSRRDHVTIVPVSEKPRVGDIVLFSDPYSDAHYLLHRVWRDDGDTLLIWGDNNRRPDGLVPLENVWGKAVLIERGKRRIKTDPVKGMRLAKAWHFFGRGYRFAQRMKWRVLGIFGKQSRKPEPETVTTGDNQ